MPHGPAGGVIRFGAFTVEPQAGVLRKGEARIRLQEQPFQVLLALLEKPGEIVSREELFERVWKNEPFGDLDHRLNIAVNKIREALRDSAETPRFVETLPRRGYRFIAAVEGGVETAATAAQAQAAKLRPARWMLVGGSLAGITLAACAVFWLSPVASPRLEVRRLTNDALFKIAPVLSDGTKLYFRTPPYNDLHVVQIPISGGDPVPVPLSVPPGNSYELQDMSPDGQEMLITIRLQSNPMEASSIWALRLADGSTRRVGEILGWQAKYSPDGQRIAFTSGGGLTPGSLWVVSCDGSQPRRLVEAKDLSIRLPIWSRDGLKIAFGQLRRSTQEYSAWEVRADGTGLQRLVPGFSGPHIPAGWTPDGSLLFFADPHVWVAPSRRFYQPRQPAPEQLSTGDPLFSLPLQTADRGIFHAVGVTRLGQLQRFDARSKAWKPHLGGISAVIGYSRDGRRYWYLTHPALELWVRNIDGSRPVQLTKAPMQAGVGRWSPDGKVIGFSARVAPDQPWRIYLVDSAGGAVRPACRGECIGMDLYWMPDGKRIVYAAPTNQYYDKEPYLRLIDVATGEVTKFPGSDGLHSPRVSPDGSMLAATSILEGNPLVILRLSDGLWRKLPGTARCGWQSWSHDGAAIWYAHGTGEGIMRYLVRENRKEKMLPLAWNEMTGTPVGSWFDLTPDDEPMILRRLDVQQIYSLELKTR